MKTVDIDFDVYKGLTALRATEDITYSDVIRELLGIDTKTAEPQAQSNGVSIGDWVTKGVRFPNGTDFRSEYKSDFIIAKVENGALLLNGKRFSSPSAAAMWVTKSSVNGWVFWECRLPGQLSWTQIKSLRRKD